jgi:hypothetical protein
MNPIPAEIASNETPGRLGYAFASAAFVSAWAVVPLWIMFTGTDRERVPFLAFCMIATAGLIGAWLFRRAIRMSSSVAGSGSASLCLANAPAIGGELDGRVVLERLPRDVTRIRFELLCLRETSLKAEPGSDFTCLWRGTGSSVARRAREGSEVVIRMPIPSALPGTQTIANADRTGDITFLWRLVLAGGPDDRQMTRTFNVPVGAREPLSRDELLSIPAGSFHDDFAPDLTRDKDGSTKMQAIAAVVVMLVIATMLGALYDLKLRRSAAKGALYPLEPAIAKAMSNGAI